jgi:hypothetical protein
MNAQNAHLYLPLVQALANGKIIQCNDRGEWVDVDILYTDCYGPYEYRIKPEPRTFDLMIRELDGSICRWNPAHANNQWKRITVQEVLA